MIFLVKNTNSFLAIIILLWSSIEGYYIQNKTSSKYLCFQYWANSEILSILSICIYLEVSISRASYWSAQLTISLIRYTFVMYPTQVLTRAVNEPSRSFVDSLESLSVIMPTTAGLQLSPKQQLQEQYIFQASQVFSDSHTSADAPFME